MSPNVSFSSPQRSPSERASEYECCPYRKMRIRQTVFFLLARVWSVSFSPSSTSHSLGPFHGPAHVGMRRGDQEANELVREGAKSFVLSLFTAAAAVTFQCVLLLLFFFSQVPGLFTRSKTKHVKEEREERGEKTVCPALNDLKKDWQRWPLEAKARKITIIYPIEPCAHHQDAERVTKLDRA